MTLNAASIGPDARVAAVTALQALTALSRATHLARTGRYAEAERELAAAPSGSHRAAALDLLARIRAQQNRLGDAESLWREAAQLEPADRRVQAALNRLGKAGRLRSPLVRGGLLLAVVAALVGAGVFASWTVRQVPAPAASVPTTSPGGAATPVAPPPVEDPPAAVTISVPGTVVTARGAELAIAFRTGVFERGTRLTPAGRRDLDALGRQLAAAGRPVSVTIIGLTDDLPLPRASRYADNAHLGMARAAMVYSRLRTSSGLDPSVFSLRTAGKGEEITPHPDRRDRRTVELRITRGRS